MTGNMTEPRAARPRVSVIVVSWNTRELLAGCLRSLPRDPAIEILVVDNASADGSDELVRTEFPHVRLIANRTNVGFARANNQAIVQSSGRYVLLLNPDTVVHPGSLEALVQFLDEHPSVGAAGARLLNPDGSLQPSCSPAPTLGRELWRLLHLDAIRPYGTYRMARWEVRAPRQVDVVQGACVLMRRVALDQVGLLDPDYFIYSEEVDICRRLSQHGWQVWWVPAATVIHYGGQSTRQRAAAMFLQLYQAKVLYFRKHDGPRIAQAYKLVLLCTALARLLISPLVWLEGREQRQQHLVLAAYYGELVRALPWL